MKRNHTLIINPFSSKCGHCGRGATWMEVTHDTVLGYFPRGHVPEPGCGARWVFVTSDYVDGRIKEAAIKRRPDLEWTQ